MTDRNNKRNCVECVFFVSTGDILGVCKRYPQWVNKHTADWCGEYVYKKTIEQITREALNIVADGLESRSENLNDMYERRLKRILAECEEDAPKPIESFDDPAMHNGKIQTVKRRGRPPKAKEAA